MNNVGDLFSAFVNRLQPEYEKEEAGQIAVMAFEHILNFRRIDISIKRDFEPSPENVEALQAILERLLTGEPIQYILGYSWFHGMKLIVNKNVLIPRRETEELVNWVISDCEREKHFPLSILDVCTGSGCIALALKKEFPLSHVTAIDFSKDALMVAEKNSLNEKLEVEYLQMDALNLSLNTKPEVVISNPPYVLESEKTLMHRRVTDYEPSSALYVPTSDPLVFYRHISEWAIKHLPDSGKIYFEINEAMDEAISTLLLHTGFRRIDFRKDFQGKIRMFRAVK